MRFLCVILLLPVFMLSSCIKCGDGEIETQNYVQVGDQMPVFTIENSIGEGWNGLKSPDDFIGNKTLLMFYTTTCPDCRRELPFIEYAFAQLSTEGLTVIPIGRGETHSTINAFWTEAGFTMPRYLDTDKRIFSMFANQTVPRLYLVNDQGVVVWMCVEDLKYGVFIPEKGNQFNALIREKLAL